jgi:excisionase family DNA binding protein
MEEKSRHLLLATEKDLLTILQAAEEVTELKVLVGQLVKLNQGNTSQHATIREAAKMLRVSERSVRTYLKEGRFSYTCSGNRKLLLISELEAYLRENHYTLNDK